jgi:hypothetical protein
LKAGAKIKSWVPVRSFTHTLEENYAIYDNIEILVEIEITQSNIDLLNSVNDSMTDCYIYNRWIDGSVRTDDSRYPMASLPSSSSSSGSSSSAIVAPRFSQHRSVIAGCYEWMWHLGFTGHDPLLLESAGNTSEANSTAPPPLSPSPAPLLKKSIPSSVDKPGIPPPTTLQATKSEDGRPSNEMIEVQKSLSTSDVLVERDSKDDDDLKKGGATTGGNEEMSRSVDDRLPSSTSPLSLMKRQSLRAKEQAKEVQQQQQQQQQQFQPRKSQERRINGGISPLRNRLQANIPDSDDEIIDEEGPSTVYNADDLSPTRTYERRNTMFDSMDDLTLLSPSQSLHDLAVLAMSPSSPSANRNSQHKNEADGNGAVTDPLDSNSSTALPRPPPDASAAAVATLSPLSPISSIHIKSRIDFIYSLDWIKNHIAELNKLLDDIKGYLPDLRRKMRNEKAFRSSVLKKDPMVQPLPTNLHYQLLGIRKHCVACHEAHPKPTEIIHSLSCGALSPHQLGHKLGNQVSMILFLLGYFLLVASCFSVFLCEFPSFVLLLLLFCSCFVFVVRWFISSRT